MRHFVGIDLGSTTTKAVILDEDERVVGCGLTNSRSDYDVACAVAQGEAMTNARFDGCSRALEGLAVEPAQRDGLVAALERQFRLAQHTEQLRALRARMTEEARRVERLFPGAALDRPVEELLDAMERSAPDHFAPGARQRSQFFRDNAASEYAALAEERAAPDAPYEALLAVFDKAILLVENRIVELPLADVVGDLFTPGGPAEALGLPAEGAADARRTLEAAAATPLEVWRAVGTGYGRARLPFHKDQIRSEILCHGLGAHAMFPGTATVLDIGGQDTKAIQVDDEGIVTSFQMNDRCAAGCGRYLGYIADEMNLGVHELGPMAQRSQRHVKISSTCTVFAGAELRERLTLGQKREDILAGLHRAIILRAMSLLARSGGIQDEFTFTGGVANNEAAVAALERLVRENYGEVTINVSPSSIYTGALGAALFARRGDRAPVAAS